MQQYQVPQFITVEDRIFGPLTTKQFFFLLGGGGLSFLFWFFFPFWLFMILATPVIAFAVSLAFVKVNGQPFLNVVANFYTYIRRPKLFLWQKTNKPIDRQNIMETHGQLIVPKVGKSRLNDLSWSLDVMQTTKKH